MVIFKLMILAFLFPAGNCTIGLLLQALLLGKKINMEKKGLARAFLAGTGCVFFSFALLAFLVICKGGTFDSLYKYFFVTYSGILTGSLLLLLLVRRYRGFLFDVLKVFKKRDYRKEQCLWIVLFLIIAVTFYLHRPYLAGEYDLPERMSTLEGTGMFCGVNPLTGGEMAEMSKLKQWTEGVMPAFYLFFASLLQVPSYRLLFQVVPLWVLGLCMSAYYLIGQSLFEQDKKAVDYFMVFFTLFTLCGNGAYMNPSFGVLHYGYEESTWISSVVIPCGFVLVFELIKKGLRKRQE